MKRYVYLTALPVILLHLCTLIDACQKFSFVSQEDKVLKGHVMLSMNALYTEICWAECAGIFDCFSINIRNNSIGGVDCELNNSSKSRDSDDLVPEQGWQYFETKEQTDNCDTYQCVPKKEALKDDWFRIGNTTFKIFHSNSTWSDARQTCQKLGGDLASINSSYENEFLFYMFHKERKSQALREQILPNLVALWVLDGSDKDVHLHGTPVNTVYEEFHDNRTLYFSGLQSWATLPAVKLNPEGFTYMIWVKPLNHSMESVPYVFNDWDIPLPSFALIYQKDYQSVYIFGWSATNTFLGTSSNALLNRVRRDVWTHVAVIWNKTQEMLKIAINGVIALNARWANAKLGQTIHPRYFLAIRAEHARRQSDGIMGFHGYMRNLMVFDRTLDQQEIQAALAWQYEYGPWIGLRSLPDGSFEWSNGSQKTFMNTVIHPTNNRCFAFANKATWISQFCNKTMPFVCERPFKVN